MKTATVKEFTDNASAFIDAVKKGNEIIVTVKGKAIAVFKPFMKEEKIKPVGFGMWKDREDLNDVAGWLDRRRDERFSR